jgi:hypothetical protein
MSKSLLTGGAGVDVGTDSAEDRGDRAVGVHPNTGSIARLKTAVQTRQSIRSIAVPLRDFYAMHSEAE